MSGGAGQRGQATVEWIGLMLGLALAFGAALGAARGADFGGEAGGLGEALASRVTCAARDGCASGRSAGLRVGAPRGGIGEALREPTLRGRPLVRALRSGRRSPQALDAFGERGIRPSAPWERAPRGLRGLEGAGAGVLRGLGRAGGRAWIVCLGYQRLVYELEHPRAPNQGIPVGEDLNELNDCLNPWWFLFP